MRRAVVYRKAPKSPPRHITILTCGFNISVDASSSDLHTNAEYLAHEKRAKL